MCERDPQVLSAGFMVLWAVLMTTSLVCVSKRGSILTGGHVAIPGPHQAWLFAQVWGLLRRLRQRFLLFDLSTRLGHPDLSLHSSAVMCKRQIVSVNASSRTKHCAYFSCRVSHLSGTRPVGTLSSCRSHCWSRRHEGGCNRNRIVKELCYSLTWCLTSMGT